MKILLTGATGYIGQNFLPQLVKALPDARIMTLNRNVEVANKLFPFKNCIHVEADDWQRIVDFNPEVVYHLATLSTSRNDDEIIDPMLDANINFGVHLLSALSKCNQFKLFVNIGSFAEYRLGRGEIRDAYLYAATKSAFRRFVQYYSDLCGFQFVTSVFYSVYGGKDTSKKIMDYMRDSLNAETPVKMTKGEQVLDFIHVDDVVSFLMTLVVNLEKTLSLECGTELHVGTGVGTKIRDLAKLMSKVSGKTCHIEWGGLSYRPLDVMLAVAPADEVEYYLGWRSKISIEEGIKRMFE